MVTKPNRGWSVFFIPLMVFLATSPAYAQETKLADRNAIGWFVYTGVFKIRPRVSIHTEYQWRRVNLIHNPQQGLFRTGILVNIRKELSVQAGYAFARSFPYGEYPVLASFPEHRLFEQALIQNPVGKILFTHRFTFEQRFIGKTLFNNGNKSVDYLYLNRFRYRLRAESPFTQNKKWSAALQDELFVGWGRNAGANIFDQNRFAFLLSFKPNALIRLEGGYINQVLQQSKRVNEKPVFQYNNGFQLSAHITIDFTR